MNVYTCRPLAVFPTQITSATPSVPYIPPMAFPSTALVILHPATKHPMSTMRFQPEVPDHTVHANKHNRNRPSFPTEPAGLRGARALHYRMTWITS